MRINIHTNTTRVPPEYVSTFTWNCPGGTHIEIFSPIWLIFIALGYVNDHESTRIVYYLVLIAKMTSKYGATCGS